MAALILLCAFLFFVAIGALVGFVRGMNKTVIRLITFAIAMVLTFFVSVPVTNLVADKLLINGQTLGEMVLEMVQKEQMVADFMEAAPLLREAILAAPAFAIGIVMFIVIFALLNFISWIVFLCIQKTLRKAMFKETFPKTKEEKKEQKKNRKPFAVRLGKRFAGFGIGAVIGALIFGMVLTPVLGVLSVMPENSALEELIDTLVEQEMLEADLADTIKTEMAVRDQAILKSYNLIGFSLAGKLYLSSVSKFEHEGQETNIPAEFDSVFSVVQVAIEGGLLKALMNTDDTKAIFTVLSNQEFVDELIGEMFKSRLFCAAIPEVMAMAMESVAITLNVPADKNAVYDNMMGNIASTVKDADIDYEGIKAYEAAQVAADYVDNDGGEQSPTIMTAEEYEAEIQKLVDLTLKIAKIINNAVSGSNETVANALADQIVQNVKSDVMENGTDVLEGFDSESVKTVISGISSDDIQTEDGSGAEVLEKMANPDKFETDVATIEMITQSIRETVQSAVADTDKAHETASTLASVVCNFAGAVESATDENGNMDIANLDFGKIADAVTELQNSNLKGVGSSVLDLVVSGDLGENGALISEAVGAIKESYDNGEDIGGTINSAGALISIGTSMNGGEASKEDIEKSFKDLVQNLNETTLKLLSSILTEDTLLSMGIEKAYAKVAFDFVDALLRELMELKDSANYDKEVETVLSIYDILSAGKLEKEQTTDLIRQMLKSQVVMNTLERVSDDILSAELLITVGVSEKYAEELCIAFSACVDEMIELKKANATAYDEEVETLISVFTMVDKLEKEQMSEFVSKILKSQVIMNMLDDVSDEILSAEFLISMGVSEKYAEDVCVAAKTCIDEMLVLRKADATAYNAEIDALVDMFDAIKDKNLNDKEFVKELSDFAKDSDVIYNVVTKVSETVVLDIAEKDREDIAKGIEEYYAESGKTERERNLYNSIAKIFGVQVTLQ